MKNIFPAFFILFSIITNTYAQDLADGKYATIKTTQGEIVIKLEYEAAPLTVVNFAGLALGVKKNAITKGTPFYNGLKFHRVIDNFMIQGGDPKGNGTGGPGYQFVDEITDLKHDRAGTLSMANSGPNTNGSQFFITHGATSWLDGKHTVFGYVIKGQDVVDSIQQNDIIESVVITDVGEKAKSFEVSEEHFQKLLHQQTVDKYKKYDEQLTAFVKENTQNAVKTDGYYKELKKQNTTPKPKSGDLVEIAIGIYLASGQTIQKKKTSQLAAGVGRLTPILEKELMLLSEGDEVEIYVPYYKIYGDKQTSISKDDIIIFNLELHKIN